MSLCILRHREMVQKFFWKFLSQEQHMRILIEGAYCFYFKVFFE